MDNFSLTTARMKEYSSWLYSDARLKKPLASRVVLKTKFGKNNPVYFYDGNNGDKHLLVGRLENAVLGVNLTQCHMFETGIGSSLSVRNITEELNTKRDFNEKDVVNMLNEVTVYDW